MAQLCDFKIKEVLRNDLPHRLVCLHLVEKDKNVDKSTQKSAVLIAQKRAFDPETIEALVGAETDLESVANNDVYLNCNISLPSKFSTLKGTLIYPATEKHIDKYREVDVEMVSETFDQYQQITLPYIEKSQFSLKWVENILDGKAEQESVLYNDSDQKNGFLLLPDLKWDRKSLDSLYFSAIVQRRGIKSIRDLTAEHLPLLENIKRAGCKAIAEKFKVESKNLRIFFHYQPSYYHLHIHFVHLKAEPIGATIGQAHLLDDVIDNLRLDSNYYQKKTLHYTLKINHLLVEMLRKNNCKL